jgi:hypothetical protein
MNLQIPGGGNQLVEGAFAEYWKRLIAKEPKLAQYPKSYQAALKNAFETGFMVGSTDLQVEREIHRGN